MKNKIFTVLFLVGFILIPSVLAANNQGLVWGVEEGQEIQYNLHISMIMETTFFTTTIDETEQIMYTIQSLPDIPTEVTAMGGFPFPTGTLTYANGSTIGSLPITLPLAMLIIPVGNWTLIDELYKESAESSLTGVTWINDASYWGFQYSMETGYPEEMSMSATIKFSKADGVLALVSTSADMGEMGSTEMSLTRVGGPLDTTTLLIIGGGAAVVLIIGVAFWKLRG